MAFRSTEYFNPREIFHASTVLSVEHRLIDAKEMSIAVHEQYRRRRSHNLSLKPLEA